MLQEYRDFSGNENQWQTFQGFTSEQHPAPVSLCLSLQLPRLPHHRCLHHRQHRLISASHFSGATVIAFQIKLLGLAFLSFYNNFLEICKFVVEKRDTKFFAFWKATFHVEILFLKQ